MELIVAVDSNWGIGFGGTQTLVIPDDRRRFRELTGKSTIIVGRRTLLDFPGGKPLKGRRNLVMTRDADFRIDGAEAVHSVQEALSFIAPGERVFVVGGESVYREFLPFCSRAYVTRIEAAPPADAFFPDLDSLKDWRLAEIGDRLLYNDIGFRFSVYERVGL